MTDIAVYSAINEFFLENWDLEIVFIFRTIHFCNEISNDIKFIIEIKGNNVSWFV